MATIYFIFSSLNVNRGGLTKAALFRSKAFTEMGHNVTFLTLKYRPRMGKILKELRDDGLLASEVVVRNYWDELISNYDAKRELIIQSEKPYDFAIKIRHKDVEEVFIDGMLIQENKIDSSGRIVYSKYFDKYACLYKKSTFWAGGFKRRSLNYRHDGQVYLDRYFDKYGICRASVRYLENGAVASMCVFDEFSGKSYPTIEAAQTAWVKSIVKSGDIVLDDTRAYDGILEALPHDVKTAAVIHMNHIRRGNICEAYRKLFLSNRISKISFLTSHQAADVKNRGYDTDRAVILPNFYIKPSNSIVEKESNYIAIFTRYVKVKRINHVVDILRIVRNVVPDLRSEIFGAGDLKNNLMEYVCALGMDDVIAINDYIKNPLDILSKAKCTMLTSQSEGLPIALLESLAVGTPIVAYDINFGPSYIIDDGVNGFIVPDGNKEAAAERVIQILTDEKLASRLAHGALVSSSRFSEPEYKNGWGNLIQVLALQS